MKAERMMDRSVLIGATVSLMIHLMLFVFPLSFGTEKITGVSSKEIFLSIYQAGESKKRPDENKAVRVVNKRTQRKKQSPLVRKNTVKEIPETKTPLLKQSISEQREEKKISLKDVPESVKEINRKEEDDILEKKDKRQLQAKAVIQEGTVEKKLTKDTQNEDTTETESSVTEHAASSISEDSKALIYKGLFGLENGPRFLKKVIPRYPRLARKLGKEGMVVLKLFIDSKGNLKDIKVLKDAGYGFGRSAIEAVRSSTFVPAMRDGRPVESEAVLTVRFKLRDS